MEEKPVKQKNSFLRVLAIGPFRNLWFAQIVSQITVNMLTFVAAVFIYEHTKSNSAVSLVYLSVGLPAALFGVFSGILVDRFNKKQLLIFSTIIRIALLVSLIFLRFHRVFFYTLVGSISLASQVFVPAEAALIPVYVPPALLLTANALFTLTFYTAIIGGFVAAGPLLALFGTHTLLIVMVGLFAVAVAFLFFLPRHDSGKAHFSLTNAVSDLKDVFSFIRQHTRVLNAILLLTLAQAVIAIFATLSPGFADRILAIKLTDASLVILGPAALGMIFGAFLVGQMGAALRRRRLILVGIYLSGAMLLAQGLLITLPFSRFSRAIFERILTNSTSIGILPFAIMAFFLLGVANSLIDVTSNTVLQEHTGEYMRGKVYGVLASLVGGVALLPVIISGIIADYFGISTIIITLGLLLLGLGIYIQVKKA